MTLWHKPTEKPKGNGFLVCKYVNMYGTVSAIEYRRYEPVCIKWCYLSDLLKLERENKRLKKEIERLANEDS